MDEKLENDKLKKILSALLKKAVGYNDKEVLEEYVADGTNMQLIKKKVTTKFVPPDLSASKLLLEYFNVNMEDSYENMTDSELDAEADRLYSEYQKLKSNTQNLLGGEENNWCKNFIIVKLILNAIKNLLNNTY